MATTPTSQSTSIGPSGGTGSDTLDDHSHPAGTMPRQEPLYNPYNVFANGVEIALYNAATVPGTFTSTKVPRVTVVQAIQNSEGDDDNTEGKVEADRFLAEGRITAEEHKNITTTPSPKTPGVAAVKPSERPADRPTAAVSGDITFNTVLTPKGTTLGQMIKQVSFPRTIAQLAGHSPTVSGPQAVVNNLAGLALNVIEPIKAKYPSMIITNSYRQVELRPDGTPKKASQHNAGQAADLQFRGVPAHSYFEIAQWINKNIPYDQLLLEYTPGKTVWIHVSYAIPGLPNGGTSTRKSKPQNVLATLNGAAGGKFTPNLHADIVASAVPNIVVA
jgi:hypothetical protein